MEAEDLMHDMLLITHDKFLSGKKSPDDFRTKTQVLNFMSKACCYKWIKLSGDQDIEKSC